MCTGNLHLKKMNIFNIRLKHCIARAQHAKDYLAMLSALYKQPFEYVLVLLSDCLIMLPAELGWSRNWTGFIALNFYQHPK